MLTRYRWYSVRLPTGSRNLGDLLALAASENRGSSWFARVKDELGGIDYRFIAKANITVTRIGEGGATSYDSIETLNIVHFRAVTMSKLSFLRIENPSRATRDLFNSLELFAGLGFTSAPVNFEKKWPSLIFDRVDIVKMIGLKVVGAVLGNDTVARMEFASKSGIHLEKLSVLSGLTYKKDFASYEVIYRGVKGQISLSSNGTVRLSSQLAPMLLDLIEKELPSLVRQAA